MKILRLPIKGKWLAQIDAGIKKDEYRDIKQHYISRFFTPVRPVLRDLRDFEAYQRITEGRLKLDDDRYSYLCDLANEIKVRASRSTRRNAPVSEKNILQ